MNLLDAVVTEVLERPKKKFKKWLVKVKYDCWGKEGEQDLMFQSELEALAVKPGYKFLT